MNIKFSCFRQTPFYGAIYRSSTWKVIWALWSVIKIYEEPRLRDQKVEVATGSLNSHAACVGCGACEDYPDLTQVSIRSWIGWYLISDHYANYSAVNENRIATHPDSSYKWNWGESLSKYTTITVGFVSQIIKLLMVLRNSFRLIAQWKLVVQWNPIIRISG